MPTIFFQRARVHRKIIRFSQKRFMKNIKNVSTDAEKIKRFQNYSEVIANFQPKRKKKFANNIRQGSFWSKKKKEIFKSRNFGQDIVKFKNIFPQNLIKMGTKTSRKRLRPFLAKKLPFCVFFLPLNTKR